MKSVTMVVTLAATLVGQATAADSAPQSARQIPVHASVDVIVVGSTTAGIAAAVAAAGKGASVFVVAPRNYLGEDLCGTLRMEPASGRRLATALERKLFGMRAVSALSIKQQLTKTLLDADVDFLFGSYATELLRDGAGRPAGVVIANRAGRQAIIGKVVIDATEQAWLCRRIGCATTPWPASTLRFEQGIVTAGATRREPPRVTVKTFEIPMPDATYLAFNRARDIARDEVYSPKMLRQAETLFRLPPATVICQQTASTYKAGPTISPEHFRPKGESGLFVLSGWADLPRDLMACLLRPAALCGAGEVVGRAAATEAKARRTPAGVTVSVSAATAKSGGDVRELLAGARPTSAGLPTVLSPACDLPVLAQVDVLVVGGGTSGAPAAIAAARGGAKTLVVEYQEGLGGVGTIGQIGKPYHGRNAGFAKTVPYPSNIEEKMEWYRREITKAGGQIWLRCLGAGAFVEGAVVKGAVVCTPQQRGVVLAKVVIDATGNGDVAISAGAEYMYGAIEEGDIALQGTGLSSRRPGNSYANSDYLLVDEADVVDVWRCLAGVYSRVRTGESSRRRERDQGNPVVEKVDTADLSTHILTRERRRVVGDVVIRYVEQLAGRTYSDAIVIGRSDYDSHGYPTGPFFALFPHDAKSKAANHPAPGGSCYSSYRAFTPKGLDGILVAGLGISMDRDVTAMVRMQRDIANQGYALGVAAAMAARRGVPPRRIDVKALQRHLVATGCLEGDALTARDNFPLARNVVARAVAEFGKATEPKAAGRPLAIILTHQKEAKPLLQAAYRRSSGPAKLLYARVLAVFGDQEVVPFLVAELGKVEAWDPKIRQGGMADHAHLPTPVDSLILALGYAADRRATPALERMIGMLPSPLPAGRGKIAGLLSHVRAVSLAAERLGDPALAEPLAKVLEGYRQGGEWVLYAMNGERPMTGRRSESIAQICLARALFRLGDHRDTGRKILEAYRDDQRGLFSRHAAAVLAEKP